MRNKITALALAVMLSIGSMGVASAHTNAGIHTHISGHGIVGDGGGWYHKSVVGSCAGGYKPTLNYHYTYLAAKRMFVWQHTKVASKPC